MLKLFLHATRAGLLDLSWEVLCPNCRSSRQPRATSLGQLAGAWHVIVRICNIKYDAEFDKSVELKFSVNPALRPCDEQTFCLAGPGAKPHVVSQIFVEAEANPRVGRAGVDALPSVAFSPGEERLRLCRLMGIWPSRWISR